GHRPYGGETAEALYDAIKRLRGPAVVRVANGRHLFAMHRMHGDRAVDDVAVQLRRAGDQRKILLLDRARLELHGKLVMGLVVPRDEDRAARVAVEAMHNARPQRAAAAAEAGAEVVL